MKTTQTTSSSTASRTKVSGGVAAGFKVVAFLALALLSFPAWAQITNTCRFRIHQTRITVPSDSITSSTTSNYVVVGSLGGTPVTVTVSGFPSGASGGVSLDGSTFSSSVSTLESTNIYLNVDTTAALAKGIYTLSINGAGGNEGVTNYILVNLQCGILDPGSLGSVAATDDVVYSDAGGATDAVTPTISVSSDTTVGSIRFSQTNLNRFHYVDIVPGAKLSITGTNGFSMLRDYVEDNSGANLNLGTMTVTVVGTNATMLVSNNVANFTSLVPAMNASTLNMAFLDNLVINVNRIGLGDFELWPNFWSLDANGYNSVPRRYVPVVNFARTNLIVASFADPNNYTNSEDRNYSLTLANCAYSGTGAAANMRLGQTNTFLMDSVCLAHANAVGVLSFNTYFSSNNQCYAYFRNTNGGRMSVFAIADMGGPKGGGTSVFGGVDFGGGGGSVDILADRFYMSRDRKYINLTTINMQSRFSMGKGVVDVNDAVLGFQEHCCHTNEITFLGYCQATVVVSNTAVFRVNNTLTLGYNVESNVLASPSLNFGRVNIGPGGTVTAGTILVGGPAKYAGDGNHSAGNNITLSGGGTLIVSNTIADADQRLSTLTMSDSTLVMNITGFITNIFVTNMVANLATVKNTINISSISGVGSSYPFTVALISYSDPATLAANFAVGTLPMGGPSGTNVLYGSLNNDDVNQLITLTVDTNPPTPLVWRGNTSSDWDTTTTNWVKQGTSTPRTFSQGDFVIFDDTATGSTVINVPGTVVPGQSATAPGIVISNSTLNYTFNGAGAINGSASTKKVGTGSFTNNVLMQPSITVSAGSLAGSGTIGTTIIEDGGVMTAYTGIINGSLTSSNGLVAVAGTVNGGLTLRAGSLTNNGTINGTLNLTTNVFLTNGSIINVTVPWTIRTDDTVVNNGTIAQTASGVNNGLTVNGNLRGSGKIVVASGAIADARVTFGPGGTLAIGNSPNEVTTMTIATRVDFNAGSKTTIDVDTSTTNDTILLDEPMVSSGKVNFGQNSSAGGVFIINKTGGPAFTTNTVLHLFDKTSNPTPDNSVQALPGVTPAPGTNLTWDVSQMITNFLLKVTTPPYMTNGYNGSNSITFSWPENYRGYRLERQTNTSLTVGLSPYITNWVTVATSFGGSNGGNNLYFPDTNDLTIKYFRQVIGVSAANQVEFFRLVYP